MNTIGIGRLIHSALGNRTEAVKAGWGGHWDGQTALHGQADASPGATNSSALVTPAAVPRPAFFTPVRLGPAYLHRVPWLANGTLMVGDVAMLTGQGGGAKTAFAMKTSVAMAAGRNWCGPIKLDQQPGGLRVGYISAEEDTNRLGLLTAAACAVLQLGPMERAAVERNLCLHDARASGLMIGEPRPNEREEMCPEAHDRSLALLRDEMTRFRPHLLVMDTVAALLAVPNENNNSAVTSMMRRLGRTAADLNCAILLLHHTPKMTRETAAAQRGEATLVRGGGAWANSARVVLSITSLLPKEGAQFALAGADPARVRRLEHVKINDQQQMSPVYFETKSVDVKVNDGTDVSVRAVDFLSPVSAAAGISNAVRNIVMQAIDAGARDKYGARVPLSPPGNGGSTNDRDSVTYVAKALMGVTAAQTIDHAKAEARCVLEDLRDRIGCVITQDVLIPKYDVHGNRAGTRKARGLVCRWDLAPWALGPAPAAAIPPAAPQTHSASADPSNPGPTSPPTPLPMVDPTPDAAQSSSAQAPRRAGIPFMITQAMKEVLRGLGYSADDIAALTPQQAFDIMEGGAPAKGASTAAGVQQPKPGKP